MNFKRLGSTAASPTYRTWRYARRRRRGVKEQPSENRRCQRAEIRSPNGELERGKTEAHQILRLEQGGKWNTVTEESPQAGAQYPNQFKLRWIRDEVGERVGWVQGLNIRLQEPEVKCSPCSSSFPLRCDDTSLTKWLYFLNLNTQKDKKKPILQSFA